MPPTTGRKIPKKDNCSNKMSRDHNVVLIYNDTANTVTLVQLNNLDITQAPQSVRLNLNDVKLPLRLCVLVIDHLGSPKYEFPS